MCPRSAGEDAHWRSSGTASEQAGLHTAGALAGEEPGRRIVFWGLFEGFNATMTSETNPSCPSAAALKVEMLMWNDWQAASGNLLWHFCESSRRSGSPGCCSGLCNTLARVFGHMRRSLVLTSAVSILGGWASGPQRHPPAPDVSAAGLCRQGRNV